MRARRATDSGIMLAALVSVVSCVSACGGHTAQPANHGGAGGRASVGGGPDGGGQGGGAGGEPAACAGETDPRVVIAPQRVVALTADQILATVRELFGEQAVARVVEKNVLAVTPAAQKPFPPIAAEPAVLHRAEVVSRDAVGQIVGEYVAENFEAVTACAMPTEACALTYLNALASKAYRRELSEDERVALGQLYVRLRSQEVNGFVVTATVQEATQYAVNALVASPQLLWRYEVGDPTAAAGPSGVRLTEDELASAISFFLTDGPPDDELRAAARAHTLYQNLDQHLLRLLGTTTAREWLRSAMELRFLLNHLPSTPLDRARWPLDDGLIGSMQTSSRLFLDDVLWRGRLTDLLISSAAFVDSRLAGEIYAVPPPAGAAPGVFVKANLPPQQRAGLLTDPALLTLTSRSSGIAFVRRGVLAARLFICANIPAPDFGDSATIAREEQQGKRLASQTAVEQVTERRADVCARCHATSDALALVLDSYDAIGRLRTTGDLGQPVETRVPLPPEIGSGTVEGAAQMADALAMNPAFVDCMAAAVLQLAASDARAIIPWGTAGRCATADVTARFTSTSEQTFGNLVRATAASPAFSFRQALP